MACLGGKLDRVTKFYEHFAESAEKFSFTNYWKYLFSLNFLSERISFKGTSAVL